MRMFAGPNGSEKSTIKGELRPELLGVYLNPDEIQSVMTETGMLDFDSYSVAASQKLVLEFLESSSLLTAMQRASLKAGAAVSENMLSIPAADADAYLASVLADFIRRNLIADKRSFTFETVMSSPDKVDLFDVAKAAGFRTYLYYIATEDPAINLSRVHNRVQLGGHPVPEHKIHSRYYRSLNLLFDAIRRTDRAYLFDNSGIEPVWLAEITDGNKLEMKTDEIPEWLQRSVLDKLPVG